MANCEKCGAELREGAVFCQKCGAPVAAAGTTAPIGETVINLAGWGDRILAYIIDMILAGIVLGIIKSIIFLPSWALGGMMGVPNYVPWSDFGFDNLFWFVYFLFMDLTYGQSIGKMVMKLKVTNLDGGPIEISQAAIEAFGKAFLLPLDLILGWIFTNQKNQRIFTFLAKTIVVKTKSS
ncbi:TPA: zinc-ribbon domain-containing protein [Candidatus Bathyarchaeota archaeon]|nr:zinc-ribbon domain-containing protein [Candidatus Bathyarchaeota archaeon]